MNFEGVGVKISDFLLSSEAFVRIGSEHCRERGFPVSGDPRSRGRSYGLDLQDSHETCLSNVLSWSAVPLATGRMNTTWKSRG
jgi:hypothetical protein